MNTENHYQETDLGNISLNPRGEYNPEESYEYLDLVVLEGGSYVCLAENGATITGISPESGKTTQYWQVITIPGSLTPEYIAMHDRVVNLSEQVEADAEEVRTAEQNVSGMELNVTQMQEQTRQSAEAAEQSKDSSAGYAASANASRQAAEESEQNVNAQVSGFDNHVAEKVGEAESDIEAARIAANKAIIAQQEQSVNEVARAGIEAISTAQSAAQTATEKAQAAATSEKNAAASETAAKLSEANATKMAEQVAADKEQVANDRTAVENAKQEMTGSFAQIEQNTQGISELKGDLANSKKSIAELNDKKITKFYASNLGETNLSDSDNGKIQDMMLYGKSLQDGTPTPESPVEIQSVVNPVVKVYDADGTHTKTASLPYTLNAIPVSSGGNVTIDGQKYIADYVDIENKKLVRNVGIFDLGTLNPEHVTSWGIEKGVFRYSSLAKNLPPNFSAKSNVITESYKSVGNVGSWKSIMQKGDNVIGTVSVDTECGFIIATSSFTDANSFKQAMAGSMICYELATPTITDLTDEEVQGFIELATYYSTTNVIVTSDQLDGYAKFNYPLSMANGWNLIKEQLGDTREYIYDMELQSAEAYVNSEYAVALAELEV